MTLKLSMAATASAAAFSTLIVAIAPAQAELFKLSFEGKGACGYVIYDNSISDNDQDPIYDGSYMNALREYFVDFGEKGVAQGSNSFVGIYLRHQGKLGSATPEPETDELYFDDTPLGFGASFIYPKGTFSQLDTLPKVLPSTASSEIYSNKIRANSSEPLTFAGATKISLEKVSDPKSLPDWSALRRRQCTQALSR